LAGVFVFNGKRYKNKGISGITWWDSVPVPTSLCVEKVKEILPNIKEPHNLLKSCGVFNF
jgi:hypothetical protein